MKYSVSTILCLLVSSLYFHSNFSIYQVHINCITYCHCATARGATCLESFHLYSCLLFFLFYKFFEVMRHSTLKRVSESTSTSSWSSLSTYLGWSSHAEIIIKIMETQNRVHVYKIVCFVLAYKNETWLYTKLLFCERNKNRNTHKF